MYTYAQKNINENTNILEQLKENRLIDASAVSPKL